MLKLLKYVSIGLLIAASLSSVTGCSKVPAGHAGIKVYLLGGSKGVDYEQLGVGRYWIGINEELYLFPTFTQNYTWTKSSAEGSRNDESIPFQTREGLVVDADVGISYRIEPSSVPKVFEKYRRGIDEITSVFLRNMVRDGLVKAASTRPIESVYGSGKTDLIAEVEVEVRNQVADLGIVIERLYWIGELRLPPTVVRALNSKIEATQKAAQRQNEVAQAKAEADKMIEAARGEAESRLAVARAEAEAIEVKGRALRDNPGVIKLNTIDKWDGKLPHYMTGDSVPILNLKN
ncbi:MAG: prohibitin family protein [Methylomicrobium sp.]|nr:prohibitin family protein [Methylomicrobium sp.]